MLVLSRKLEESLIIDEDIEIIVIGIEEGKVKLGINAPKNKKIYRKEVLEEIKRENKNATKVNNYFLNNL
ncbi:MAG: carbon storage regulator CsrA [Firmicutes bacterium]|nr:carbon storage regulator CsrA [Bacillota bacterium]